MNSGYSTDPNTDMVSSKIINFHHTLPAYVKVIIEFNDSFPKSVAVNTLESILKGGLSLKYSFRIINAITAVIPSSMLQIIASFSFVKRIEIDSKVSIQQAEPLPGDLGVWKNGISTINADKLWDKNLLGDNITIGIVDTGVDGNHPDLDDIDDNATTNDPKIVAFKDFVNGRDDLNPKDGMSSYDDNGHGTAVAGIISGTGSASNGKFRGVAPHSKLIVAKVLNQYGFGNISDIIAGIDFCVSSNVNIISLSIQIPDVFADSIARVTRNAVSRGVIVVAAAGNSGPHLHSVTYPGALPEVISVGASFGDLFVPAWSSVGPATLLASLLNSSSDVMKPDIVAPGFNVITTKSNVSNPEVSDVNATYYFSCSEEYSPEYYFPFSGTSAATPFVSGAVALLLQKFRSAFPLEVKLAIMKSARDLKEDVYYQGMGLLDAYGAYSVLSMNQSLSLLYPGHLSIRCMLLEAKYLATSLLFMTTENITDSDISLTFSDNLSNIISYSQFKCISNGYFLAFATPKINFTVYTVGRYIGAFTVTIKGKTRYNSQIELNIVPYRGKVLYDVYHQSTNKIYISYSFAKAFITNQFFLKTLDQKITSNVLQFADVLVLNNIEKPLEESEISAIQDWINKGGVLIAMAGYYNTSKNNASFDIDSYNALLAPYGIQASTLGLGDSNHTSPYTVGDFYGEGFGGIVSNSPITTNVTYVHVIYGDALKVNETKAQSLIKVNEDYALLAYAKAGKGGVIAIGDDTLWIDTLVAEAALHGADNYKLIENIANFVNPQRPVVYDFWLWQEEHKNCTLFLFAFSQNGPVSVTMAVKHIFAGWENTTIAPKAGGYLFVIKLPESIFGYDVILTITDPKGITRVIYLTMEGDVNFTYMVIFIALIVLVGVAVFIALQKWRKMFY